METIARGDGLIRVVVTGSESTGKTVLARQLADHYGAELAPEFLRDFAMRLGRPLEFDDTQETARGQISLEDNHRAHARELLIQDTDLLSTVIYCNHYYGRSVEWITKTARDRRPDLYLLTEIDVPWIPDNMRDRENRRDEMQQLFRDEVAASGSPYAIIRGSWQSRFAAACDSIDELRYQL